MRGRQGIARHSADAREAGATGGCFSICGVKKSRQRGVPTRAVDSFPRPLPRTHPVSGKGSPGRLAFSLEKQPLLWPGEQATP